MFIKVQMVQPYNSTDMATAWKNSCFILLHISDYHMIFNMSIAVHALPIHMLTSSSIDEILLPSYVKWSTNFRVLPFRTSSKLLKEMLTLFSTANTYMYILI